MVWAVVRRVMVRWWDRSPVRITNGSHFRDRMEVIDASVSTQASLVSDGIVSSGMNEQLMRFIRSEFSMLQHGGYLVDPRILLRKEQVAPRYPGF